MLYELRITHFKGIELTELTVEKETAKQFKVSGSKLYRNTINKSETERVQRGSFPHEYFVWFTDLAELSNFKLDMITLLQCDLEALLDKASEIETNIETLKSLEA